MCVTDKIIDNENGKLTDEEVVEFFQYLIDSKMVYNLQGHYQRMAKLLIDEGLCKVGWLS